MVAAIAAVSDRKIFSANEIEIVFLLSTINCLSFSEKERQLIVDNKKTVSISLAKNILRAETAAIAATTILTHNLNFK